MVTVYDRGMGFKVSVGSTGMIHGTTCSIGNFVRPLEHWVYNRDIRRSELIKEYFYYDKPGEAIYLPIFLIEDFKRYCSERGVGVHVVRDDVVEGAEAVFHMMPWVDYKNEKQEGCVNYLTTDDSGHLRGVALQTGAGKTVSFIWGVQKLARRTLMTMTSRLNQWVDEITKYTTLEEDDIYVVQGIGGLNKLFSQIDKTIDPKFILFSAKTLKMYMDYPASYQHLPHPSKMCEELNAGILGTDEYHEHFYTNYTAMIINNPKVFIPITATFVGGGDQYVRDIFDKMIPASVRFTGGEYKKYVNVTAYKYGGGGWYLKPFHYKRAAGYSQVKFEESLMHHKAKPVFDSLLEDALIPIIKEHYIEKALPGQKFLMLCATKEMCNLLEGIFRRRFQDKTVSTFYSGKPEHILEKFDMILSTPGSAGTGRDVKNLRTCLIFDNTQSEIRNLQYLGRLRELPPGEGTPEYIYISFAAIPKHNEYAQGRSILYSSRALSMTYRSIR